MRVAVGGEKCEDLDQRGVVERGECRGSQVQDAEVRGGDVNELEGGVGDLVEEGVEEGGGRG